MTSACGRDPADEYTTAEVVMGDVRDVVPAVGTVRAVTQVEVRADTPGRVVEVLVDANARVVAGQVLARIQPDRLALDVEGARAEQRSAEAAVAEARARSDQASKNLENRRVLAEKDFISPAALNDAAASARAASAALDRAEADAARAGVQVRTANGLLADVLVRAPIDGFVLSRTIEPGQVVSVTSETPLFVIASASGVVLVEALVAEPDIARITPDARIAFTVEAYPRQKFSGRLRDILRAPQKDRNFVSYPVLIEADDPSGRLFPGMTASVEFIHADARNVLRLPAEALYFTPANYSPQLSEKMRRGLERRGLLNPTAMEGAEMGALFAQGKQRVFAMEKGVPTMRAIRIGAESGEFVEVTEGLRSGDVVATGMGQARQGRPER